jgi:hypothetical protein
MGKLHEKNRQILLTAVPHHPNKPRPFNPSIVFSSPPIPRHQPEFQKGLHRFRADPNIMLAFYFLEEIIPVIIFLKELTAACAVQGLQHFADKDLPRCRNEEGAVVWRPYRTGHEIRGFGKGIGITGNDAELVRR